MNNHSKKLKSIFQNISIKVHDLLFVFDNSDCKIRQINEDGISSIILKEIAKLNEQGVKTKVKSLDVQESETGIDFDIWIGENDNKYIRLLVQAKSFLNHTKISNSFSFDDAQCIKLINHAKQKHEAFPLYFLYQYIVDNNLKEKHFNFIEDFIDPFSSITFTSAQNILQCIESKETKFKDVHENVFEKKWINDIFSIFEKQDIHKVALPFYLLHDLSPSKIEKFNKLVSKRNNTLGFFFFFFFFQEDAFKIHDISAKEIEKIYSVNPTESELKIKNLVIINDNFQQMRKRNKILEELL